MENWALLLALVGLVGCKSEQRLRHERLAQALKAPVSKLCFETKEGGGCNADCIERRDAIDGRSALAASRLLASIAPTGDAVTDARLKPIRESAATIEKALAEACSEPVDWDTPISPALTRCANANRNSSTTIRLLADDVDQLASDSERRTGVKLPSRADCRQ